MRSLLISGLVGILGAGAALAAETPIPMPAVQAKMKAVVDKASTDLFNTASQADPENGPDQKLPDAAGWAKAKGEADDLKAVADWLQQPANGRTTEAKWMQAAQAMSTLSAAASKAAAAHDAKGLAKAANDLSDTCTACHSVYKKQG
jgi:hypothetical protein